MRHFAWVAGKGHTMITGWDFLMCTSCTFVQITYHVFKKNCLIGASNGILIFIYCTPMHAMDIRILL